MKIASIGYYPDYDHKDFDQIPFSSTKTILECDMVIINFNFLDDEYPKVSEYNGKKTISKVLSTKILNDINRRKKEIEELLESGKNILIISPVRDFFYRYTGKNGTTGTGRNAVTTEYVNEVYLTDIIPVKLDTIEISGKAIEVADKRISKLFTTYEKNFEYYCFLESNKCEHPLLKIKGTSKVVGWYENIKNGILLFLPNQVFDEVEKSNGAQKEKKFFKDLYKFMNLLKDGDIEKLPEWTKKYKTQEEIDKIDELNLISLELDKFKKKYEKANAELLKIEEEKQLFVTDDTALEKIVKNIFINIGFKIIKFGGNQEDIVMSDGKTTFVVEIKGCEGSSNEKHTSQTVKWRENYFIDTNERAKGILIVNSFNSRELDNRQDTFPTQLLKYAEYQDLCLISSIQLFNLYKDFLSKKLKMEELASDFVETRGLYKKYAAWDAYLKKPQNSK